MWISFSTGYQWFTDKHRNIRVSQKNVRKLRDLSLHASTCVRQGFAYAKLTLKIVRRRKKFRPQCILISSADEKKFIHSAFSVPPQWYSFFSALKLLYHRTGTTVPTQCRFFGTAQIDVSKSFTCRGCHRVPSKIYSFFHSLTQIFCIFAHQS